MSNQPTYDELLKLCKASLRYLSHPDVQAVTHGFALSGAVIERRLEDAIAQAEGSASGDRAKRHEQEIERLRGLLRAWTDMDPLRYDVDGSTCPWCEFDYSNMRHEADCAFVLARSECGIAKAEGGQL